MSERNMSHQNLVLIRSAEDPDVFGNWGGSGWGVPPLGTAKTGTTIITLDNSTTPADNTPGEPIFEIAREKALFNFPEDHDDKESGDVSGTEMTHDPGKEKIDISLEVWENRGSKRYCTAKRFNPITIEYRRSAHYPRFDAMVVEYPKDASDNPVFVDEKIQKSDFTKALSVIYFRDVIFKSKGRGLESGEKVRSVLAGHAVEQRDYNAYEFGAELKASGTISPSTPASLDSQPKIPTRIEMDVTVETAPGDIVITGTNVRGEAITSTITTTGIAKYYTDKVFATVDVLGLAPDATLDCTASFNAAELY